jgi:guanylate kinase
MEDTESSSRGKLIIVFGPTGSGKSVLVNFLREKHPELNFPLSYTTRAKRPGSENSSYRFVSVEEFNTMKDQGAFLEWAQFGDNFYGTLKEEILTDLSEGKVLFKEMELQGVIQTQKLIPTKELVVIYIDAGAWEGLSERVRARAPISEDELAKRKQRYEEEIAFKDAANFVIQNPDGQIESAKKEFERVVESLTQGHTLLQGVTL